VTGIFSDTKNSPYSSLFLGTKWDQPPDLRTLISIPYRYFLPNLVKINSEVLENDRFKCISPYKMKRPLVGQFSVDVLFTHQLYKPCLKDAAYEIPFNWITGSREELYVYCRV